MPTVVEVVAAFALAATPIAPFLIVVITTAKPWRKPR